VTDVVQCLTTVFEFSQVTRILRLVLLLEQTTRVSVVTSGFEVEFGHLCDHGWESQAGHGQTLSCVCVNRELDINLCITLIPKHKAVAYNRGSR
jgi:hypothetical protein